MVFRAFSFWATRQNRVILRVFSGLIRGLFFRKEKAHKIEKLKPIKKCVFVRLLAGNGPFVLCVLYDFSVGLCFLLKKAHEK